MHWKNTKTNIISKLWKVYRHGKNTGKKQKLNNALFLIPLHGSIKKGGKMNHQKQNRNQELSDLPIFLIKHYDMIPYTTEG